MRMGMIEEALPVQNKTTTAPDGNTPVIHDCNQENSVLPDVVADERRRFGGSGSVRFSPPSLQPAAEVTCFRCHCHLLQ